MKREVKTNIKQTVTLLYIVFVESVIDCIRSEFHRAGC
jgi:hypothetical protein